MRTHNRNYLKKRRKELRNKSTKAEVVLWWNLKNRQLDDRKFRRQHSIGKYVVDFYCPEEKLVVELDGEPHFDEETIQYDINRTKYINKQGITVIRFENEDVIHNLNFVLKEIKSYFKNKK